MLLYHAQDSRHNVFLYACEEINLPPNQMQGVNIVDILLAFVHFPFHPMSIQIAEQITDIFGSGSVSFPFSNVEGQEGFVGVSLRFEGDLLKMSLKVTNEVIIKIFPEQVR